ncbi:hypothetical protein HBH56_073570 [Parastagonospora nodorum]|uniref:F-box domain-containing protein n=2 Tax=Phaeosphaeria nodorum (strain SN15 / ATCC MYA-4574 / FGSC 10173) TaxID=321614 RepID=A0A7U2NQG0_PHANO|nr:hypothetical protein HBH56_073570 [Parastagonospora nodorum]QRD06705.1 hypothetical protein JI435_136120 [Parastagonospora nodorum SN15]KAH3927326.1 hypothetical protein HBH54_153810 [Parastagonospora nodorum]KAH3982890.1 hypothetical protein HBH52_068160 [Parastagonospora nodorum]KAH4069572.1 hypothetical protein HBH50_100870 [Parastagonospora nodorum]
MPMLRHIATSSLTHIRIPPASPDPQPQIVDPRSTMARKDIIKGVEAVGSKTANRKRTATDNQVRPSRKRQKIQKVDNEAKDQTKQEKVKDPREDGVFRLMDLPGELRNQIYGYAVEFAHRCFPPIFPKDKSEPKSKKPLLPHIGLTQASSKMRSEFRPAWLSTHKIPLFALDGYLKAFYPRTGPGASDEVKKRLESTYSRSGLLRVWVRKPDLDLPCVDILQLIKHTLRFPDFSITVSAAIDVPPETLSAIQAVLSNKAARWVSGIKGNKVSQLRLRWSYRGPNPCLEVTVVVKDEYAPRWMRAPNDANWKSSDYAEALGLGRATDRVDFAFRVDYS